MVDIELFKKILSFKDNGYITSGDTINNELLMLMVKSPTDKVKSLFKKQYEVQSYMLELKCEICGELYLEKVSKSKLMEYIYYLKCSRRREYMKPLCPKCLVDSKKHEEENKILEESRIQKKKVDNTKLYIDRYLNPDSKWRDGVKTFVKINELNNYFIDDEDISEYINGMSYQDFLKTPYWKAITEKVRYKSGFKCNLCGSNKKLNIHHRDYTHHGDELHHMEDLICLCEECHSKFHNKI